MHRVLDELQKLRSGPDDDTVHDLRVAIRRCRSIAAVMEEVDPHPDWPEMRKAARKLFRGLGAMRDAQVLEDWVKQLAPEDDPVRAQFLAHLKTNEKDYSGSAERLASKFNTEKWRALDHALRQRIRVVPIGGLAAECLALERLEQAREHHTVALRTASPKPWHGLRIALKKFRYAVESLLPEHYAAWSKNLKRLQDLLGDIHDLDVLAEKLSELHIAAETSDPWHHKIEQERNQRIETYRQLTLGKTSLWHEWRHALPYGDRLGAAVSARLGATARAADKHARRTAQESRVALRLFDILRRRGAAPLFEQPTTLQIMRAAARLHGVSNLGNRRAAPKAVRKFLKSLALPPNWSADDWDLMTWSIRYQRGPEPKQKNGFGKLNEAQQNMVRIVAGTLRLARALRKTGVQSPVGLRSEKSLDAFVVRVPALPDTAETAGRLAVAKHLLEAVLPKPFILKPVPQLERPQAAAAIQGALTTQGMPPAQSPADSATSPDAPDVPPIAAASD